MQKIMNQDKHPLIILSTLSAWVAVAIALPGTAQIVPDASLPNNSTVNLEGTVNRIGGGTVVGESLFHSFGEFSVPAGTSAHFDNALEIENIFSRVTGVNISNIDGLIRANGRASLFLLNPNGIVFGPNTRLDIGGSFLGTTATGVVFPDGSSFSATNPEAPPLLTINVPLGLQLEPSGGTIAVNGSGRILPPELAGINEAPTIAELNQRQIEFQQSILQGISQNISQNISSDRQGLWVEPGKTLALVGGNLSLSGGVLGSLSGQIELWSVKSGELRAVSSNGELAIIESGQDIIEYGDIELSRESGIFASGLNGSLGGGRIRVRGRRVTLRDGSEIRAETFGAEPGGTLTILAAQELEILGAAGDGRSPSLLTVRTWDAGNAGNIAIETGRLRIRDGAKVQATTTGSGRGGTITVRATESVELSNIPAFSRVGQGSQFNGLIEILDASSLGGTGDAGEIAISTERLVLRDGARVGVQTLGSGRGGRIEVRASESVEIIGVSADGRFASHLSGTTFGAGDAGSIAIETRELRIRDGGAVGSVASAGSEGQAGIVRVRASELVELTGRSNNDRSPTSTLSAVTSGLGDGGSIEVEAGSIALRDGAEAIAATNGPGKGGTVTLRASESIEIIGRSPSFPSLASAATLAEGDSGDVRIETEQLFVGDSGRIDVTGLGSGNPGSIEIAAAELTLENNGAIAAVSQTGRGGNITARSRDILLRQNSSISAAGSETGNITEEGNINIEAETLVLLEGSNIITSAADPQGGSNIAIRPLGSGLNGGSDLVIFKSPDSTINARGELTIEGDIQIEPPDIAEVRVANLEGLIASGCEEFGSNTFWISGRGGLPPNPADPLPGSTLAIEWATRPGAAGSSASGREGISPTRENRRNPQSGNNPIVEATGWMVDSDGTVILTTEEKGCGV